MWFIALFPVHRCVLKKMCYGISNLQKHTAGTFPCLLSHNCQVKVPQRTGRTPRPSSSHPYPHLPRPSHLTCLRPKKPPWTPMCSDRGMSHHHQIQPSSPPDSLSNFIPFTRHTSANTSSPQSLSSPHPNPGPSCQLFHWCYEYH